MLRGILSTLLLLIVHSLHAVDLNERRLIELVVAKHPKENLIIFDVGAHAGEWSDNALHYAPDASLFLFEPSSHLVKALNRKYIQYDKLSVFHLALSNTIGTLTLFSAGSPLGGYHFRQDHHDPSRTETTPTTTLDAFCLEHNISHIDLLKIDTEGAEFDILNGASSLLASKSIDVIQFEYGGAYLDAKTTLKAVYNFLISHGYKVSRIDNEEVLHVTKWNPLLENYNLANYCAYLPGKLF